MNCIEKEAGAKVGQKSGVGRYIRNYTLAFLALAAASFSVYIASGRTLIWTADAWAQHFKALVYYADYLRDVITGNAHAWDFSIGEGGDVLTTLHYYVVGDPLTALSAFVPTQYMHIFYDMLSIIRMYLAGLAFSAYAFLMGQRDRLAVGVGSFTYSFSYWALLNAGRHPYFLTPMVYFPILLVGFELVIRKRRPYVLILAVAAMALSNFYFFYMAALLGAFYVICRVVHMAWRGRISVRRGIAVTAKIAGYAVVGVMIASVVFVPVVGAFLQDSRADVDYKVGLLYPLLYYTKIPGLLAGEGEGDFWLCAGFSAISFPALMCLFRRKGRGLLKFFVIAIAVAAAFPVFGHILNGFSYVTNRWSWVIGLTISFVVTSMWGTLLSITERDAAALCIGEGILLAACAILRSARTLSSLCSLAIAFILIIFLIPRPDADGRERIPMGIRRGTAACLTLFSLAVCGICMASPEGNNYASEHVLRSGIMERLFSTETAEVKRLAEDEGVDGFYRVSGTGLTANAGLLSDVSSAQYFWSMSNPNIVDRNVQLALRDYWLFRYSGLDGRTVMNTLSSVRYYVKAKTSAAAVPYGYEMLDSNDDKSYNIYENKNALSMFYTYDAVIGGDLWNALEPEKKEEALMYGAYLDGEDVPPLYGVMKDAPEAGAYVPFSAVCSGGGIEFERGEDGVYRFIVAVEGAQASLVLSGAMPDAELYFCADGMRFHGTSSWELYHGGDDVDPNGVYDKDDWDALPFADKWEILQEYIFWDEPTGVSVTVRATNLSAAALTWYGSGYQFYNGRDDFIIDLGCHAQAPRRLTLTFPKTGIYEFDDISVYMRALSSYDEAFSALADNDASDAKIGRDSVSCHISLDEPRILTASIPYSSGWRAYVNGEPARLYRANLSHMALLLDAGDYEIELRYETPYLRAGALISAAGAAAFCAVIAVFEIGETRKRRARANALSEQRRDRG